VIPRWAIMPLCFLAAVLVCLLVAAARFAGLIG
jgi:hypothetical protein